MDKKYRYDDCGVAILFHQQKAVDISDYQCSDRNKHTLVQTYLA
jgi:hypothetical protein